MKILAIEFSGPERSVAVLSAGAPAAPAKPGEPMRPTSCAAEVVETGAVAGEPLGMIESVLRQAQLEREQIECLAIGLGPGSYVGIRGAIALAQGWGLARGTRLLGISSAECIAATAAAEGLTGPVAVVIDAQRGEFYLALYELAALGFRETQPLRLATLAEVQACQANGANFIGPEVNKWFPAARRIPARAAVLAQLATARSDFVPGEQLQPIYLRETTFVKAPPPRVLPA